MKLNTEWKNDYLSHCEHQLHLSYETLRSYQVDLKQFHEFYKETDFNKESAFDYIEFLKTNLKTKSIIRKLNVIRSYFIYLNQQKLIDFNPYLQSTKEFKNPEVKATTIPLPYMKEIFLITNENLKKAKSTSKKIKNARDLAMIELLASTGIRASELYEIKLSDMNFENNILSINGSNPRQIPLTSETTVQALHNYYNLNIENIIQGDYFFISNQHQKVKDYQFRKILASICEQSNLIPKDWKVTPIMFRNTFIELLLNNKVSINEIKQIIGAKHISTTLLNRTKCEVNALQSFNPRNLF